MPTARRPGMDHSLYPYSAVPNRPAFVLPSRKPIVLNIVLQIEHYELLTPDGAYRDPRFKGEFGSFTPDYRTWSYREYGNRVGLYRVLDTLDDLALPVTTAIGAGALESHPEIASEIASRDYEIVAHGLTANRMITSQMSEAEERAHIATSRDAITTAFGAQPRGWLAQDFGTTPRTSALLREQGFSFTMDWANDEQPYRHLDDGGIVALPAPSEWDDVQALWLRKLPVDRFPALLADAVDLLEKGSSDSVRAMALGVHPWMFGAPHRIRYLREALQYARSHPAVEIMTAGALARCFDDASAHISTHQEASHD